MGACFISYLIVILAAPPVSICDGEYCATPLQKGEAAPYKGQLLTPKLALDLGLKAEFCDSRLNLELNFQKKNLGLDFSLAQEKFKIAKEAWEEKETLLLKRLREIHSRPFYEHPVFVATVTVICTILIFWGARETLKIL